MIQKYLISKVSQSIVSPLFQANSSSLGASSNNNSNKKSPPISLKFCFSTATPKQQYARTFLLRMQYNNPSDAYYQTYPFRQKFRAQIKALQNSNKCHIFGGDQFPLQSTQLVINCDNKDVVQDFVKKNVYQANKLLKNCQIQQVEKVSQQSIKKLTYFYQYQ